MVLVSGLGYFGLWGSRGGQALAEKPSLLPPLVPPMQTPSPLLAPTPSMADPAEPTEQKVVKLRFIGNRKVEDDAISVNLATEVGTTFSPARLREDIRNLWKTGFFDDVQIEAETTPDGIALTYRLREKPSIFKILIAGNKEVELSKINEILDLRKDAILDISRIKRNEEKIRDLYLDKGFYLAEVHHELKEEAPGQVTVTFRVDEHAKVEIREIRFVGNHALDDEELKSVMSTQEGNLLSLLTSAGTYKEEAFERDLLLLTAYYYDRGYIQAKIARPDITLSPDKRYMYMRVNIEEGPQFRVGKLDVRGDMLEAKEKYLKRLHIKTGEIFSRSKLSQDMFELNDHFKDRGYAYVNVTPVTNLDPKKLIVDLTYEIQKGELVYFERINVRGNTKTRDKVIRREMKIAEGELFSQTLLETSKRRVQALGFFEKVEISTQRGSGDNRIEVNVEVAERPTGTFQIGAGFSSVENFITQAQVSQNNLFGRGQTLSLQAQLSSLRQLFLLRFVEPYFLDTPWTFAFSLFNQSIIFTNFQRNSTGGDLTWGYLFGDDWRVFLTYKLEQVSTATGGTGVLFAGPARSFISSTVIANLFNAGLTSLVRGSVSYDTRNDRMFPTKGQFHTLSMETSDPVLGAKNVFSRMELFTRFYKPIWGPFVFKLNVQGGWIFARSHCGVAEEVAGTCSNGVPIFERFFLGGIHDVRGFRLRALGPRVQVPLSSDPNSQLVPFNIGGNVSLYGNAEVEFPIFAKAGIKGVVFLDAGNAFNLEGRYCNPNIAVAAGLTDFNNPCQSFNPLKLRTSWGFGFRWFSPIGPLRFEWGLPFAPQPDEDRIVFEFTIGNFF